MKKAMAIMVLGAVLAVLAAGCATSVPLGLLYTEVKLPAAVDADAVPANAKVGVAECRSFLGIVAMGDASIMAAKRNGGITKVYCVDWEVENVLGFIGKYRTVVYGE